jgi:hypothetical protein
MFTDVQFIALLAAIIHAGADDNERESGYSAKSAVCRAVAILKEAQAAADASTTGTRE